MAKVTLSFAQAGALLLAAACAAPTPMVKPSPKQLETNLSSAEVVRRISNLAVLNDFDIVLSDPVAGTLSIRRQKSSKISGGTGNAEFVSCKWTAGSIGDIHAVPALTATVSVRQNGSASTVLVNTRVNTEYPALKGAISLPESETDCVSNEKLESMIAEAIQG